MMEQRTGNAYGACPDNEYTVPGLETGYLDGMPADGQRFDESSYVHCDSQGLVILRWQTHYSGTHRVCC